MRAAVLYYPRELRIEDRAEPRPGPDQVAVQVRLSGICGTDIHLYQGNYHRPGSAFAARVLGHDFAGTISARGANVTDLAIGDRVIVEPTRYCGVCIACRSGAANLCERWQHMGMSTDGCLQDIVLADRRYVHLLPESVSDEAASILEPVAVALHVFDARFGDRTGDEVVVVIGCGPIGLATVQVAKLKGHRVVALDIVPQRLAIAGEFGADLTIDARESDTPARVMRYCENRPNLIVETAGTAVSAQLALNCATFLGRLVFVALSRDPLPLRAVMEKEIWVTGARTGYGSYAAALELVAKGDIHLEQLITHRFPLDELRTAFETLLARPGEAIRVAIDHSL